MFAVGANAAVVCGKSLSASPISHRALRIPESADAAI
jgi:hypothetical protein